MYHYFYKITNNINGKYYYGIHSTENLNDGYMGSGSALKRAFKKEGKNNFSKEIIKFFDNRQDLEEYEKKIVNENLIYSEKCYNIATGGYPNKTIGSVLVKGEDGVCFRVFKTDEEFLTSNLLHPSTNTVTAISNIDNKTYVVDINEFYENKNLYHTHTTGKVAVKDENNKTMFINVQDYHQNKEKYKTFTSDKVLVKDVDGTTSMVYKNDERYINGELKLFWCGRKHTEETKNKIRKILKEKKHQQGEKNSQYGTCWVNNGVENIRIKKEKLEEYITKGFVKGRFINNKTNIKIKNKNKIWINKNGEIKFIYKSDLIEYVKNGWRYGKTPFLNKKAQKTDGFIFFNEVYKKIYNKSYE